MPHIKSYTRIQDRKMAFFLLTSGKINYFLVLWIRIGFNADPDPAFYLSAHLDRDPLSQTNADSDLDPV
jgi:hypothetical protein